MKLNITLTTAITGVTLALSACGSSPAMSPGTAARAAQLKDAPPAPSSIVAVAGDHNAVLRWNGFPQEDGGGEAVTGYRVTWGKLGGAPTAHLLTTRASAQLQPLENGAGYEAVVQAVTWDGRVSAASTPVRFTGDPTRVNALRARMNGFFDDFSQPTGFPDALKWNLAVSACNLPEQNGFFVNTQFHVHNKVASRDGCAKGQSVSRPRVPFDFAGRTGTIAFDLDGAQRSDQWYLDLVPELMDIGGQVGVEDGLDTVGARSKNRFAPGNVLRIHQSGQDVQIIWIDGEGYEHLAATANAEQAGVPLLPNLRRPFEVHINQHHADVSIDGIGIVATDALNLPFTRAHLLWNAFTYDTRGNSNEAAFLLHWGNFGFDAPAGTVAPVTHDYADGILRGDPLHLLDGTATRIIRVPDPVRGAVAARLMLTVQAPTDAAYEWSPSDHASLNGRRFDISVPSGAGLQPDEVVSDESPYTVILQVPAEAVVDGDNTVEVGLHQATFLNLHLELDFDPPNAGPYTPPSRLAGWAPELATPKTLLVGPGVTIDSLGGKPVAEILNGTLDEVVKRRPVSVSGRQEIKATFQDEVALNGTGSIRGVSRVELLVDGTVAQTRRVDLQVPSPGGMVGFDLDTTKLRDGPHTVEVRAIGADGAPSLPDYEAAATRPGDSRPLRVEVRNHPWLLGWLSNLVLP